MEYVNKWPGIIKSLLGPNFLSSLFWRRLFGVGSRDFEGAGGGGVVYLTNEQRANYELTHTHGKNSTNSIVHGFLVTLLLY